MKRTGWGFFLSVLFLIVGIINVSAANVVLDIPPGISVGQMFDIKVIIDPGGEHVAGAQLDIEFNNSNIFLNSIAEGNFLKQSGMNTYFNSPKINNTIGKAININGAILGRGNVTTPGTFIIINATSISSTNAADINLTNILVVDPEGNHIYPNPTPKPTVQAQTSGVAPGDGAGGNGPGSPSGELLPEPEGSNKTLLAAAFIGIIIFFIIVYKYVIPKYSELKGKRTNIDNKMPDIENKKPDIEKQNKILKTTHKKLSSIIRSEVSDGSTKNIAADTKLSESSIKKVRATRSKDNEPIQMKKTTKKKIVTGKRTGKTAV